MKFALLEVCEIWLDEYRSAARAHGGGGDLVPSSARDSDDRASVALHFAEHRTRDRVGEASWSVFWKSALDIARRSGCRAGSPDHASRVAAHWACRTSPQLEARALKWFAQSDTLPRGMRRQRNRVVQDYVEHLKNAA